MPWVLLALVLAGIALTAGYFLAGPALSSWLEDTTGGEPDVSQTPEVTPTPSPPPEPGQDVTPVCTEQEDGSLSCVVTP